MWKNVLEEIISSILLIIYIRKIFITSESGIGYKIHFVIM